MHVVTTQQMRRLEQAAVDAGATWPGLMEQAGWGVAQEALRRRGTAQPWRVLVLVGPGNNGGDGLVAARHLRDAQAHVSLYIWNRSHPEQDANWHRCRQRDLAETFAADDPDRRALRRLLQEADLVIDALLGMGVSRPVAGDLAAIVALVNEMHAQRRNYTVLAVDMPTGVHSDSGAVLGVALQADVTVATGMLKRGLLLYPGRSYAGDVVVADIGIPSSDLEAHMSQTLTAEQARALLPARAEDGHKGTFGKVLVVAGSLHYPGAAILATTGGARVGAGLVTLASGRSVLAVGGRSPEVTILPLPEADWGTIGAEAASELFKHLEGYQSLLIGPGLGHEEPTRLFLQRLLGLEQPKAKGRVGFLSANTPAKSVEEPRGPVALPPTVLDADGLNLLATIEDWPEHLPKNHFVFTPHPGEMKRLLKVEELESDLVQVASDAATRWGQVVVLKGATTVIAAPDGRSFVHDLANPALASAGTGDVLSGAIAGLLAQGCDLFAAAALGVYLHGAAGVLLREELGDTGTLASDLFPRLPRAIKALRG